MRRTRALAILASAASVPVTASRRPELAEAGAVLEALGDLARAAEAYRRAQDVEGQARVLARSGEVERLDDLLEAERAREHETRARRQAHEEFDLLVASGRRREAVDLARSCARGVLRTRGLAMVAKKVTAAPVRVAIQGREMTIVLGERIVVGRAFETPDAERAVGALPVASAAVSRRHLSIVRREGEVWVHDLGSHNGTTLRGRALEGETRMGAGLDLVLGGEVSLALHPADDLPGAIVIEVAGSRYVAALGPTRLGIGQWRLECARSGGVEDWVELVTDDSPPAFAGGLQLSLRVSLLLGDAFATRSGGEVAIRFEG